jgi:Helix-hairpin-helix domain
VRPKSVLYQRAAKFGNNRTVAAALRDAADILSAQGASPFRALAYQKAASTVEALDEDIGRIVARGSEAVDALPNIGKSIASAIVELVSTGCWSQLERLRGALEPEAAFRHIPGVGPGLAQLIHDHLHVDTLEALEVAAHDGRLATVPGIGKRRAAMIRSALHQILSRRRMVPYAQTPPHIPPIDLLLDIDREYRERATRGELKLIAPKRFNPKNKAWLPVLHAERGEWQFTALFSNTARAHQLGRTTNWVIIFFSTDHLPEGQCTIVTETSGAMKGRRVVRGREAECAQRRANPG